MGTVLGDNQTPTYSAGYGGVGSTYAIDEYAISYELAQSPAQEPFSDAIYDRLTTEVAIDCKRYGIPPVMIEIPRQTGAVPTGIVRHDRCENGIKLGKTDPGDQFDEARFIADVKAEMEGDSQEPQPEPIEEDDMLHVIQDSGTTLHITDYLHRRPISDWDHLEEMWKLGKVERAIHKISDALMASIPKAGRRKAVPLGATATEVADELARRLAE
jgi:hypothetical protein